MSARGVRQAGETGAAGQCAKSQALATLPGFKFQFHQGLANRAFRKFLSLSVPQFAGVIEDPPPRPARRISEIPTLGTVLSIESAPNSGHCCYLR